MINALASASPFCFILLPQEPRPDSLAYQRDRDDWIIDVVAGIECANLIEQLDIPHVDVQYLRDLVECPEHADFSTGLPDDLIGRRIDEGNTSCNMAPTF